MCLFEPAEQLAEGEGQLGLLPRAVFAEHGHLLEIVVEEIIIIGEPPLGGKGPGGAFQLGGGEALFLEAEDGFFLVGHNKTLLLQVLHTIIWDRRAKSKNRAALSPPIFVDLSPQDDYNRIIRRSSGDHSHCWEIAKGLSPLPHRNCINLENVSVAQLDRAHAS